jgi:hypothetical protein
MAENLTWNGNTLYLGKRIVGEIVQDERHPSMWRVPQPDGTLSDMVNRTRAKDACAAMAATVERKRRQSRTEAPKTDYFPPPLPATAPNANNRPEQRRIKGAPFRIWDPSPDKPPSWPTAQNPLFQKSA